MESHRLSGSSDVRVQRSYVQEQDNLFGVRVRVQGIKGQPYIVLNTSGQESHRDVSVITHQAGYNPGMVRRSVDERRSPAETQRAASSSGFHYQQHPEILSPYDPENNNLTRLIPSFQPGLPPEKTTNVTKPRIPSASGGPS